MVWLLGNKYDRMELAGAFGDLGTLIPFVVAYITINGVDPLGVLFGFGVIKIISGAYYRTPFPVQPMKAIGVAAIAGKVPPEQIWGAGIFTGIFWLAAGLTGTVSWITKLVAKPVVSGIMLGLGLSFILQGVERMMLDAALAAVGLILTLFFLSNKRLPAMLVLLAFGIGVSLVNAPSLLNEILKAGIDFKLPHIVLGRLDWQAFILGSLVFAIPQLPLTLGNAIIAVTEENNKLFPERKVTEKKVSISTGIINFASTAFGGVPQCHGAGGMAGHVRFGARTGGALVMLGILLLVMALFFSESITLIFSLFPPAILGVILFYSGAELASIIRDMGADKKDVYVMVVTAGAAIYNMGVAFLVGMAFYHILQKGWADV